MPGMVYMAGPIDFADSAGVSELSMLREECHQALMKAGFAVFDPSRAFSGAMADPRAAWTFNETAIMMSVGVLALLPRGVQTVGTPMEIQTAVNIGKPVVVIGATGSMQLQAMGVPCLREDDPNTPDVGEFAVDVLRDRIDGAPRGYTSNALKYTSHDALFEPVRNVEGDAGLDLVVSETTVVPGHGYANVPHGIRCELPPNMWGLLVGRSSTIRNRGLMIAQAVIDNGYRGEMFAGCWNLEPEDHTILRGERVAQLVLLPLSHCGVERVSELSTSERGDRGFGSSGT